MKITKQTIVVTESGHYPLRDAVGKMFSSAGRTRPAFVNSQDPVYLLTLNVNGERASVEAAGTIALADGSTVPIADLVEETIVQEPVLDYDGNPALDDEGSPLSQDVIVPGSSLAPHILTGGATITLISKESLGTMGTYSTDTPLCLGCGLVCTPEQ